MNKYHVFDLDGTLINSMPSWSGFMIRIVKEGGGEIPENFINIITPLGYAKTAEYIKNLVKGLTLEEVSAKIQESAVYAYTNEIELKPYVLQYLNKLKDDGCKIYVLTASPHPMTDAVLKRWGVFDMFDHVWSSDDLGYPKSDMRVYHEAARVIGTEVNNITFYDDNLTAVTTAHNAGLNTVAVYDDSSSADRDKLIEISDKYIDSFEELL